MIKFLWANEFFFALVYTRIFCTVSTKTVNVQATFTRFSSSFFQMWWLVAILSVGLVHCQSNYEIQAPSTNYTLYNTIEDEGALPSFVTLNGTVHDLDSLPATVLLLFKISCLFIYPFCVYIFRLCWRKPRQFWIAQQVTCTLEWLSISHFMELFMLIMTEIQLAKCMGMVRPKVP